MSDLDLRHIAERWVDQFYISDVEWKEVMVEQYMEYLHSTRVMPEYIKPYLIVSNNKYKH